MPPALDLPLLLLDVFQVVLDEVLFLNDALEFYGIPEVEAGNQVNILQLLLLPDIF